MTSKVLISRKLIKTQVCNSKYSILNPGNKVAWCKKKRIVSPSVISNSVTPWTVARQAPLSTGFSRQEYWSGMPFPSPGDLPDPGSKPRSPALQTDFFYHLSHQCFKMYWLSWTCVWASSGSWWWTGKPGVLQSMGSQRVRHSWVTELNWGWVWTLFMLHFLYIDCKRVLDSGYEDEICTNNLLRAHQWSFPMLLPRKSLWI